LSHTALQASTATPGPGQPLTLTATVSGADPGGTVRFTDNGSPLGSAPLVDGVAVLQASWASAGARTLTAHYDGDANNEASSSTSVHIDVQAAVSDPADGDVPALPLWGLGALAALLCRQLLAGRAHRSSGA
jgi:hypothetical protein